MEQKKFIHILKKIIKEEVRSVIKEELTEILQEGLKPTISELQNKRPIKESVISRKTNGMFKDNKYSDILNETTSLREQNQSLDFAELMKEDITMTSKDAQGFGIQRQSFKEAMGVSSPVPTTMEDTETGKTLNVDPIIAKAITRDYSSLMKAMDKKKKNK